MVELASGYGRYGYRQVTALLQDAGWRVNHKRIERLWRQEGLKVPQKQPKRQRLRLNDGSCCGSALRTGTMFGAMTLLPIGRATDGRFGC